VGTFYTESLKGDPAIRTIFHISLVEMCNVAAPNVHRGFRSFRYLGMVRKIMMTARHTLLKTTLGLILKAVI
jgi:hypothetical protein